VVGEGTMIDMGAILGGRATVGKICHPGHCGGQRPGRGQRRSHRGRSHR
jgi:hypothetical protein